MLIKELEFTTALKKTSAFPRLVSIMLLSPAAFALLPCHCSVIHMEPKKKHNKKINGSSKFGQKSGLLPFFLCPMEVWKYIFGPM